MTRLGYRSFIALAALVLAPVSVHAQAVAARDYLNTPVDDARFFINLNNGKTTSAAGSPEAPLPNNESLAENGFITILYAFPVGGRTAAIALVGGRGTVSGTSASGNVSASGFADPSFTVHLNLFGGPAARSDTFKNLVPQTFSSLHVNVTAPFGSYDRNAPVNMGANRWAYTGTLNLSLTGDRGASWTEFYVAERLVSNNNAYQGTNQLTQLPLTTLTAHYSHNLGFGKGTYAAIGLYYNAGGESFVNGVSQNNALHSLNPTASVSTLVGAFRFSLRLNGTQPEANTPGTNAVVGLQIGGPLF